MLCGVLFVVCWWFYVARCLLLRVVDCCLLLVVCYSLIVVCRLLFGVVRCVLLLGGCCSLCVLFVISCSLSGACCL